MTSKFLRSGALAAALFAAASGGYFFHERALADSSPPATVAVPVAAPATAALPDFSAIVARYGPAVVNVSTTSSAKAEMGGSRFGQMDPNDPFYFFFKRFGPPGQQGERLTRGIGSGFIVKSDGTILTNAHVVQGAAEVKVKLTDKREFTAKVIGLDKPSDIAVLKIDAHDLPVVTLGQGAPVKVGEWALAIGSPFGFENSATAGIVSAEARSLPDEGYVPFIQTDVPVNPGNSGGPLFNTSGQVIGINSQIFSQSGGYMGLSFAIPINVAMHVEQELLAHGKVVRGRLGVTVQDVNQSLAQSFGLERPDGALVSSVEPEGPAAKAGVEPGDIILSLNGKEVTGSSDLPPRVANLAPGTEAKLEVWRNRGKREVDVRIAALNDKEVAESTAKTAGHGRLGLAVRPLTPEEQGQAGVKGGVVVEEAHGPAAIAGIQPGDVVLAINGTRVSNVDQLRELASKAGSHVALLVERGNARIFVPLDLG